MREIGRNADMFGRFRDFWSQSFIQETPAELSQCEFGCRATNCRQGKWERCKNRLLALERDAAYAKAVSEAAATSQSSVQTHG